MRRPTKALLAALAVGTVVAAGAGIAVANSPEAEDRDETERPITGTNLDRASEVALDHLGEGRVMGTEVGDEESYYEVEVTLEDGGQVDVQLDEAFNVVGDEAEGSEDDD